MPTARLGAAIIDASLGTTFALLVRAVGVVAPVRRHLAVSILLPTLPGFQVVCVHAFVLNYRLDKLYNMKF